MKTLTKMKKVCCFNRFVLLAMTLSMVTSFTACSSDDDSDIPVYSLKDVDGNYSGTMLTESTPVSPQANAEEGEEPAGAEVTAEVKDNQIMIKKLPVDDLIKSIVGEENAGAIIENLGDINYNIPYTPTFDEGKSNILLQLKPEPLEIKYTEPIQVQEEGQEPAENLITVTIEAEKNGVYAYDGKKLAFVIKATGVKVGDVNFPNFPVTTFTFSMVKKLYKPFAEKKKMEHACAQDMLFFYTFVKKPTIQNDYNRKHSKRIAGFGRFQVSGISFCPGSRNREYSWCTYSATTNIG